MWPVETTPNRNILFIAAGLSCTVTGWGVYKVPKLPNGTYQNLVPDKLQYLPMNVMSKKECKKNVVHQSFLNENMFCATGGLSKAPFKV